MVTALNQGVAARDVGYEMWQYCCARVVADPTGADVTKLVGKLPAGAVVIAISSRVVTAITGGAAGVVSPDLVASLGETAGSQFVMPLPDLVLPLATDTEFYTSITGGATAGVAYVALLFYKPIH